MTMTLGNSQDSRLLHLRSIAERVGTIFASHPAISAVAVFGSVAHGQVDEFSDVDLLLVCRSAIPPMAERRAILNEIGSGWQFDRQNEGSVFPIVDEDGQVADVLVTVHYKTAAWIDAVLDAVLERGAITTEQMPFRPYTVPALFQRALVLLDRNGDVARWREASRNYPSLLQANILRQFMPDLRTHVDELKRTAERDLGARNIIFFLNWAVDDLTSILLALNGVYDPADRWMHTTVMPFLSYLPSGYVATMTDVLEGPFDRQGARHRAQFFEAMATDVLQKAGDISGADA
jgi:predicted nucleotidyltransferase